MNKLPTFVLSICISAASFLSGCATPSGSDPAATPPQASVQFLDLQGFDRSLSASLGAPLPKVDVAFVDVVKPSAMPERLQKWMAAVEAGGGKVAITPPKSTVQGKSIFALVSAVTTVYSASKMAASLANEAQFKAARAYDAEIVLKTDANGDNVVDKVVFTKR